MQNRIHKQIEISSFYNFFPIPGDELAVRKLALEARAAKDEIRGLLILAEEGLNGTISGSFEAVLAFEQYLPTLFSVGDWSFKRSQCEREAFKDFRVKLRPEIVTTRAGVEFEGRINHLTPEQWQKELEQGSALLLDTRNTYETALGVFEGAVDPQIQHFSQFPQAVERLNIPRDQKILMYCTGGIRCEKAIVSMEKLGYENVYQLDGGILNYLEQFPNSKFKGECFVFDNRVSVDQQLQPSQVWHLCPHCGQPGKEHIDCQVCSKAAVVCESCLENREHATCSKDCSYRLSNARRRRDLEASLAE